MAIDQQELGAAAGGAPGTTPGVTPPRAALDARDGAPAAAVRPGPPLSGPILHFGYSHTLAYVARETLLGLRARGWDIHLGCPDDRWTARLRRDGFEVHPVDMPHRATAGEAVVGAAHFTRLLGALGPALVHTHNAHHGVVGRVLARAFRVPSVHTWRYSPLDASSNPLQQAAYRLAESVASRAGREVLFQNHEDLRQAVAHRLVAPQRAVLVHNGIDVAHYAAASRTRAEVRAELGVPQDAPLVVCIARLAERKGLPDLLEAIARLTPRHPDLRLCVLGTGPALPHLEAQAVRLGLAPRVHFAGQLEDVRDVLHAADALCLSSRREGIPRAVLEAMAARLPVVGTDVVGTRAVVRHGETGLLVPYGQPAAIAVALDRLLCEPALARGLVARAEQDVRDVWDVSLVVDRIEASYLRVLGAPTAHGPVLVAPLAVGG